MVNCHVVTWPVPHRAPVDWHLAQGEQLASILNVGEIFHFEGDVMHSRARTAHEIYRMMVRVAAQEDKKVLDPVRYPKPQHAAVEFSQRLRVLHFAGDMTELKRPRSQYLMMGAQIVPFREQFNGGACGIVECEHLADTRDRIAQPIALHTIVCQLRCNAAEVGMRRDLKRNSLQIRRRAAFQSNGKKPGFAGQKSLTLALGMQDQSNDFRVVGDRSVEVGCLEGGVSNAACLDHDPLRWSNPISYWPISYWP